ncbi:phosphoglycerate dehydrogenase [Planococcus salinus]|uniref:Glycerate dehydrogenase n=1 Tax=Planococcus salinus TaxID=1848460 RepID=A0A3M8P7B3_9BACL|nr:phosphoglycerate dehydrogenase [Planococcus salinus]RNF39084.1 glycerate dehydrogenase [Planococcus salinus]
MKLLLMLRDPFYEANPGLMETLTEFGEVRTLYTDEGIDKETLKKEVKDVDIILVAVVKIDKEIIDAAPKLKYVLKYGAGYDNIDVSYANQKGIRVTNAPGVNAQSAADHGFGLLLSAAREIPRKDKEMKNRQWELTMGFEIHNKKLGIIGFGAIGQALAKRAKGFDMETIVYGNYQNHAAAEALNAVFVEREYLFREADFIMVATSLSDRTRHLINKETLSWMKPTAILVNISRGPLVNEEELIEALRNRQIKGAALDVFEQEPVTNELPLLENVIATPHVGGATYESVARIGEVSVSNIRKFLKGEELDFEVH